jgi:hypothetical protein
VGVKHIFEVLRNKKQETCIMRWYKKAAAVLLAAAMAVSMMTACGTTGGGNGGNGGNNGSKPGTSEDSGNGGNGGNNGSKPGTSEGGDEKPDKPGASVIPADPAKVTWDTSLTKKCYNAVSADDFKVSGLLGGGAFGYATQGKKQFVVNQEDQNTMIAFYTPDGESLYLTSYKLTADTTDTTVNDLTWTSIEKYGKSKGANDEKIAKEKQGILEELKEIKNLIYIANKVVPLTFSAENYTDSFAQEFYRESIKANVDGVVYTYEFYYAAKDMADGNGKVVYKKGDMTRIRRVNGGTSTQLFVSTQLSRCDAKMFPKGN